MEEEEAPVEQTLHKISLKRTAVSNLREHWNNRSLSDISVSLHVAGSPVCEHALHKMVLCSSAYFNSLIKGEWGLVDRGELRPDDPFFTVDAFEAVLRGLYGFEVQAMTRLRVLRAGLGVWIRLDVGSMGPFGFAALHCVQATRD